MGKFREWLLPICFWLISTHMIKRAPTLDPLTPLATQLHILNLFGGYETPYESLHAVVK
jgi:dynein heavy chain 1